MDCKLEVLGSALPLAEMEATLRQWEAQDYEVVSLAAATVGGLPGNVVTFRHEPVIGELSLVLIDGQIPIEQQETAVQGSASDDCGLVGYGSVYVQGALVNVAAYRR